MCDDVGRCSTAFDDVRVFWSRSQGRLGAEKLRVIKKAFGVLPKRLTRPATEVAGGFGSGGPGNTTNDAQHSWESDCGIIILVQFRFLWTSLAI